MNIYIYKILANEQPCNFIDHLLERLLLNSNPSYYLIIVISFHTSPSRIYFYLFFFFISVFILDAITGSFLFINLLFFRAIFFKGKSRLRGTRHAHMYVFMYSMPL